MPQIRTRIAGTAARARAGRIERTVVVLVAGLLDHDAAGSEERLAVARVPRGQHAIEHVDTGLDRDEEILRRADAHQIARARGIELASDLVDDLVHLRDG